MTDQHNPLPVLPEPDKYPNAQHAYTADQMREYGQFCSAHARKVALEEIAVLATVGATYPELMEYIYNALKELK